jgi:hypothetical protein
MNLDAATEGERNVHFEPNYCPIDLFWVMTEAKSREAFVLRQCKPPVREGGRGTGTPPGRHHLEFTISILRTLHASESTIQINSKRDPETLEILSRKRLVVVVVPRYRS